MVRIVLATVILIGTGEAFCQSSKGYMFDWTPPPIQVVREHAKEYFTKEQYEQVISFQDLFFEVEVDPEAGEVVELKYSKSASRLSDNFYGRNSNAALVVKLEDILRKYVRPGSIKHISGEKHPDKTFKVVICLHFDKTDLKIIRRWK
jgi:hypothetical protein